MTEAEILHFQEVAAGYVQRKRVPPEYAEDLVQEMVLYAVERNDWTSVDIAYLRAEDVLNKRIRHEGERKRQHLLKVDMPESWEPSAVDPTPVDELLPAKGSMRAMLLLLSQGWTQVEIAQLWGVSQALISRRLQAYQRLRAQEHPPIPWNIQWLTL